MVIGLVLWRLLRLFRVSSIYINHSIIISYTFKGAKKEKKNPFPYTIENDDFTLQYKLHLYKKKKNGNYEMMWWMIWGKKERDRKKISWEQEKILERMNFIIILDNNLSKKQCTINCFLPLFAIFFFVFQNPSLNYFIIIFIFIKPQNY